MKKEDIIEEEIGKRKIGTTITIMTIKILNWNARGLKNKKELSKRIQEYDFVLQKQKQVIKMF